MLVPIASSVSLRQIPVSRERLQAKTPQMLPAGNLRVDLQGKVSVKTEQGTNNTCYRYDMEIDRQIGRQQTYMLTDTDTGTDRNKKQDLWKAKQRYIEGLEVRKNAPKKTKRCIEGLEVKKKKKML